MDRRHGDRGTTHRMSIVVTVFLLVLALSTVTLCHICQARKLETVRRSSISKEDSLERTEDTGPGTEETRGSIV